MPCLSSPVSQLSEPRSLRLLPTGFEDPRAYQSAGTSTLSVSKKFSGSTFSRIPVTVAVTFLGKPPAPVTSPRSIWLPIGSQIDLGDVTGAGGLPKNVTATVTGIRLKVEPENFLLTLNVDVPADWYARGSSKPVGRRRSERGSES